MADGHTPAHDPGDQAATGWTDAEPVLIGDEEAGRQLSSRAKAVIGVAVALLGAAAAVFAANPGLLHPGGGSGPITISQNQSTVTGGTGLPPAQTPATPTVSTPNPTATPCTEPTGAHGFSATFLSPCDGDALPTPWPSVTLAVPSYPPHDGSQGSIWLLTTILTDGHGVAQDYPPTYAASRVEAATARPLGHHTWSLTPKVYGGCKEGGPAEFSVYWLTPAGTKEALRWKENEVVKPPPGNKLLARVDVQMTPAC